MSSSKKGIFGYRQGLSRFLTRSTSEWFDPSTFLIHGQQTLPDEGAEKPTFWGGKIALVFLVLVVVWRLTNLQIVEGQAHRFLAEGNRVRRQITIAPRGSIVDRRNVPLVTNQPGYSLELVPSDLPQDKDARLAVFATLAQVTGVPVETVTKLVTQVGLGSLTPVSLQANLDREKALVYKVKLATTPGVHVSFVPTRHYDTTPGLAHLLGYTSELTDQDITKHPDYNRSSPIGRSGLESSYDVALRGQDGVSEVEVNANGQLQRPLDTFSPQPGKTVHLTLDQGLQAETVAALQEAMAKNNAQQAAAIALDPRTGGILASVSLPSYDNNLFAAGISTSQYETLSKDPNKPLLNRTVDGLYPAGSTIKPFVAAAALQEKTITPSTTLDTSAGVIEIGQFKFPDWKKHGVTDVKLALAQSNDLFFYALGGGWDKIPGLGVERLRRYYSEFGFGQDTGVDYTTEQSGLVPTPEWKKKVKKESWYIGDTYHIAIGQGDLLVTPTQLARALSSLVNGGRLVTPHLVASLDDPSGVQSDSLSFPEQKISLDANVIETVRQGMYLTVNSDTGSARALRELPFSSGGKTGTAQFGTEEKTHAWYVGFAPYDNPEIVVTVIVEGGGEGNAISVPVAGRMFNYYMSHRN